MLSAGQEQLVAFARILVRDPHVVILDEATARMDPVTEARVQRATERLLRGRIGIVIAHRLSSVRRCDEVVVLADGEVVEAGPLRESRALRPSCWPAATRRRSPPAGAARRRGVPLAERGPTGGPPAAPTAPSRAADGRAGRARRAAKADPPPLPRAAAGPHHARDLPAGHQRPPVRPGRGRRCSSCMVLLGLDGSVLPLAVGRPGRRRRATRCWPAVGIVAGLLVDHADAVLHRRAGSRSGGSGRCCGSACAWCTARPGRAGSASTPRPRWSRRAATPSGWCMLADNLIDQSICVVMLVSMTAVSGSFVPALFFVGTMVVSGLAATLFGPRLERSARRTVAARAAFATALVSSLSAARTVKLAGATAPVLAHLARLDAVRSDRQRREISMQVWARSTPSMVSGLLPIGAWALYLAGDLSAGGDAGRGVHAGRGPLVRLDHGVAGLAAALGPGVDPAHGRRWPASARTRRPCRAWTSPPAPRRRRRPRPRNPLRRLELAGFSAVHEDGTVGVRDVDLTVERGQLVLVVGPVGVGQVVAAAGAGRDRAPHRRAALERRAGHRAGAVPAAQPGRLRGPAAAGAVRHGRRQHPARPRGGRRRARCPPRSSTTTWPRPAAGSALLIGHKGTRLSGGQLQRLALARALAPRTELLIADDVSSALDVTTELELWRALREHGRHRGRLDLEAGRAGPGRPGGRADRRQGRGPGHLGRAGGPLGPPGRLTIPPRVSVGHAGCLARTGPRGLRRCPAPPAGYSSPHTGETLGAPPPDPRPSSEIRRDLLAGATRRSLHPRTACCATRVTTAARPDPVDLGLVAFHIGHFEDVCPRSTEVGAVCVKSAAPSPSILQFRSPHIGRKRHAGHHKCKIDGGSARYGANRCRGVAPGPLVPPLRNAAGGWPTPFA